MMMILEEMKVHTLCMMAESGDDIGIKINKFYELASKREKGDSGKPLHMEYLYNNPDLCSWFASMYESPLSDHVNVDGAKRQFNMMCDGSMAASNTLIELASLGGHRNKVLELGFGTRDAYYSGEQLTNSRHSFI